MIEIIVALINAVAPVLGAIAACGAVYVSWRNGQKVDRTDAKIDAVKETAKLQHEEIDLMKTGAFRAGHVAGVEYQRSQSDFSKLSGK